MKESWPEECLSEHRVRCIVQEYREEKRDSFGRQGGSGMDKSEKRVQAQEKIRKLYFFQCETYSV